MQHNFYSGWVANYWQINYSASIFVLALENYMTDKKITSQFDAGSRNAPIPQFSSSDGRNFEAAAKFGETAANALGRLNRPESRDLSGEQNASIIYAAENMSEDERKMSTVAFATRILGGNERLTSNGSDWNHGASDELVALTAYPDRTKEMKFEQQIGSLLDQEKNATTEQEKKELREKRYKLRADFEKSPEGNPNFATETYDLIAGIDGDKKSMTVVELSTALTIADENRDGKISYSERKTFVENMRLLNQKEKDQPQVDA